MTITATFDYNTPGDYTTTGDVEVSGGTGKVQDLKRIGANFNTDETANWNFDGPNVGNLVGGAGVASGVLDCRGNSNDACWYEHTVVPTGSIKFQYIPNYTQPASDTYICTLSRNFSVFNRLTLFQDAGPGIDGIEITIYDDAGSIVANAVEVYADPGWTANVAHELELNYDSTTGDIELFINGVSGGVVNVGPWSRGTEQGRCILGALSGSLTSNARFDDLVTYQSVQNTTDYTPGYTIEDKISGKIIRNTSIPATSWDVFDATETIPEGTELRYTVILGSTEYWFDSANWVVASGDLDLSETNTLTEIQDNLATLPFAPGGNASNYYAYLSSSGLASGASNVPEIDEVSIEFVYDVPDQDCPDKSIVFADSSVSDCGAVGTTLRIVTESQFFLEGTNVVPNTLTGASDDEGIARIELFITENKNDYKYHYYIDYFDEQGNEQTIDYGYAVGPDALATNISDITFTSEP